MNHFLLEMESALAADRDGDFRQGVTLRLDALRRNIRTSLREGERPEYFARLQEMAGAVEAAQVILDATCVSANQ